MARLFDHQHMQELAKYAAVPVINGLTDSYHPVQLLADYMTIIELKKDKDLKVAYIGDGNNMTHSWLMLASKLGFELSIATPKGYEVDSLILKDALDFAKQSGAKINITNNPQTAIKDASVVTTDTWISMGQENQKEQKLKDFNGFIVDKNLMNLAKKDAIFLHCLPAYRGYEVSEEIFEQHNKTIFLEAENRLHAQKGLMVWLDKKRS
jgi:ornithine carbamoyltransferase